MTLALISNQKKPQKQKQACYCPKCGSNTWIVAYQGAGKTANRKKCCANCLTHGFLSIY